MSKRKEKGTTQKRNSNKKMVFLCLGIIILVTALLAFISYLPFYPPFLPKQFVYALDNTFASVPFIPKTGKQVLTRAILVNQDLENYTPSLQVVLKNTTEAEFARFTLQGNIRDAALYTSSYQAKLSGAFEPYPDGVINLSEEGNNFSFQVGKPLPTPFFDFSSTPSSAYKVDLEEFEKSMGVSVRDDGQILKDIKGNFENMRDKFTSAIPSGYRFERLDNKNYYRFDFAANSLGKEIFPSTQIKTLTLWVAKDSFVISKVYLKGVVEQNVLVTSQSAKTNQIIFEITYSLLNSNFSPDQMTSATNIASPIDLWLNLAGKQNDKSTQTLFEAAGASGEFGSNFLTVERMFKVIFLLPKAV